MKEERKDYLLKYQKEKLKRVPFDLRLEGDGLTYEKLCKAAAERGESISGFIKAAIIERMGNDNNIS